MGSTMRPRCCIAASLVASGAALCDAVFARFLPQLALETLSLVIVAVAFLASFLARRVLVAPVVGDRVRVTLALILSAAAAVLACVVARQA